MKLLVFIMLSKLQRKYQNTIVRLHKYHIVQQYVSINKTIKIILQRIVYGLLTQILLQRIPKPACNYLRVENRNKFVVSLNSIKVWIELKIYNFYSSINFTHKNPPFLFCCQKHRHSYIRLGSLLNFQRLLLFLKPFYFWCQL